MNDTTNTTTDATQADPLAETRTTVQKMRRACFKPDAIEANAGAIVAAMQAVQALGLPVVHNYDPNADVPEGHAVVMLPIPRNRGKGQSREVVGLCVGIVPTGATTQAADGGASFVEDAILGAHMNKLANAVRKNVVDGDDVAIPGSVADFLTNQRTQESLEGFNKVAPRFVKALGATLKGMNKTKLRDCLSIAAYAEQQYESVPQESWTGLLAKMVAECHRLGVEPGALETWGTTRDAATKDAGTFDLDGLDSLLAENEDGSEDGTEDGAEG